MAYASDRQHISQITVDTDLPSSVWGHALPLALRFWQELAQQPLLSESFQIIAVQMLHSVQHAVAEQVGSV